MNSAKASALFLFAIALLAPACTAALAETCTTQADLAPVERDRMANAARGLATSVQSNDASALRARSVAELAKDLAACSIWSGSPLQSSPEVFRW